MWLPGLQNKGWRGLRNLSVALVVAGAIVFAWGAAATRATASSVVTTPQNAVRAEDTGTHSVSCNDSCFSAANEQCGDVTDSNQPYWLFVVDPATFVSLTVTFSSSGTITLDSSTNGTVGEFLQGGKHAAIFAPLNQTILSATAVVTGDKDFFTLSHVCGGSTTTTSGTTTESTGSSSSGNTTSSNSSSGSSSESTPSTTTPTTTTGTTPATSTSSSGTGGAGVGAAPNTGGGPGAVPFAVGVGLLLAGGAGLGLYSGGFRWLRRRRPPTAG